MALDVTSVEESMMSRHVITECGISREHDLELKMVNYVEVKAWRRLSGR
jgi:hypothetical protein